MNLESLDLNLLVALNALLAEGSVNRASTRLGLSQPATSHALRRLRVMMRDPLLVRVGARMELTPRALALRGPLREILAQMQLLLDREGFDPATSNRHFALMMPDHLFDVVLPPLVARVRAQAPGIRLGVEPWKGPAFMTPELARQIDVVIACASDDFPGFHRQMFISDTDAVAIRRGHSAVLHIAEIKAFLEMPHVAVVGYGQTEDMVDAWLRGLGLTRRIALVAPSYLQALHMVARTDLVAIVPRRQAESLANALGLDILDPPIDPGTFEEYMFHPTRLQVDASSIWLRSQLRDVGRGLEIPPTDTAM